VRRGEAAETAPGQFVIDLRNKIARTGAVDIASEALPQPPTNAVQRVTEALKAAPRIYGRQEKLRGVELSKRAARIRNIRKADLPAEEGLRAELGALKGPLPKLHFESIRGMVQEDDVNTLFKMVRTSPLLRPFEGTRAQSALAGLLNPTGGAVPVPSEISLLNKVFGDDFTKELLAKRPTLSKMQELGYRLGNAHRAFITSYDLSASFFQGAFLAPRHPKAWGNAFVKMFQSLKSEEAFQNSVQAIRARPTYRLMQRSKLDLTKLGHLPNEREEMYMDAWADKIPGVRASGRAFTSFLNHLRADTFDSMVRQAEQLKLDPLRNSEITKDIATWVNTATGRGRLGKLGKIDLERNTALLNGIFFAPKLIASRVRILNPATYLRTDVSPFVRKEAFKDMLAFGATALTTLKLASMAGAEVQTDFESADFGKIKLGNTRLDPFGGFSPYIRFAARFVARIATQENALDVATQFAQQKTSPVVSFALSMLSGKDFKGDPFDPKDAVGNMVVPLAIQDVLDAVKEWGPTAGLFVPGIALGVRTSTYD
jgi:hypothetical protein